MLGIRRRRELRLAEAEVGRAARRMTGEDVTVLGEQLSDLHEETLATPLTGELAEHYQRALDAYEDAKRALAGAELGADLTPVHRALEDGRWHRACVLALQAGEALPERLPSCFFDPQHGPSTTEVRWTPPGGVERAVPVCAGDRNRLERDTLPAVRMVRVGTHLVPWFAIEEAGGLRAGQVDVRRVLHLRAEAHGRSALYGADPMRNGPGGADLGGFGF